MSPIALILNILWILLGGIGLAFGWLIAAVIMAITIIGIPWARAAFNIAAPRLPMIALKDFYWEKTPAGGRVQNCPMGEGMVNWKAYFALLAKNLVRGHLGREWMAIRDMDVAAEVIGIRPVYAKLTAFAVSSFIVGVAGALWGFVYLGSWEPAAFSIDRSFQLLFMVIIGGLGSIMGSFFGAAFIVLLPLFLNSMPRWLGIPISVVTASHLEFMIFGALIVFFLIVEPHGLARLWSTGKEKLRLWPFPH